MKKNKLFMSLAAMSSLSGFLAAGISGCSCNAENKSSQTKSQFVAKANEWFNLYKSTRLQYAKKDLTMKIDEQVVSIKDLEYVHHANDEYLPRTVVVYTDNDYYPINCYSGDHISGDLLESGVTYKITDNYIYYKNPNAVSDQIAEMKINQYGYYEIFNRQDRAAYTMSYSSGGPTIESKVLKFSSDTTSGTYILIDHGVEPCFNKTDQQISVVVFTNSQFYGKKVKIDLCEGTSNSPIDSWEHTIFSSTTYLLHLKLSDNVYNTLRDNGDYHFEITALS